MFSTFYCPKGQYLFILLLQEQFSFDFNYFQFRDSVWTFCVYFLDSKAENFGFESAIVNSDWDLERVDRYLSYFLPLKDCFGHVLLPFIFVWTCQFHSQFQLWHCWPQLLQKYAPTFAISSTAFSTVSRSFFLCLEHVRDQPRVRPQNWHCYGQTSSNYSPTRTLSHPLSVSSFRRTAHFTARATAHSNPVWS